MSFLAEGLIKALELIAALDPDVFSAVYTTLEVSIAALAISSVFGVPLGYAIGMRQFWGRDALITLFNTLIGMPTVAVGLIGYALLTRQGLLGGLNLLFTKTAIGAGQFVLAFPIVVTGVAAAIKDADRRLVDTALTLGASRRQLAQTVISQNRFAIIAAIVLAFGRCVSEVGAAMILGGNIRGQTRTITTAIALETSKGEFSTALALGMILLLLAFGVNILLRRLQSGRLEGRVIR